MVRCLCRAALRGLLAMMIHMMSAHTTSTSIVCAHDARPGACAVQPCRDPVNSPLFAVLLSVRRRCACGLTAFCASLRPAGFPADLELRPSLASVPKNEHGWYRDTLKPQSAVVMTVCDKVNITEQCDRSHVRMRAERDGATRRCWTTGESHVMYPPVVTDRRKRVETTWWL